MFYTAKLYKTKKKSCLKTNFFNEKCKKCIWFFVSVKSVQQFKKKKKVHTKSAQSVYDVYTKCTKPIQKV